MRLRLSLVGIPPIRRYRGDPTMTRYLTLLAVVCLAHPVFAVEDEQSVLKDNAATKIQNAINHRIDKALELSEYCADHPSEAKCVQREKAEHDRNMRELGQANEALEQIDKSPALKGLIERNMASEKDAGASERREFLNNIKEMCKEPTSEACKTAKQDYADWKAQNK